VDFCVSAFAATFACEKADLQANGFVGQNLAFFVARNSLVVDTGRRILSKD